jgi:hypothetical protein
MDRHFIKEKLEGVISIPFVPTTQPIADVLTKGLLFEQVANTKLGMLDIFAPT